MIHADLLEILRCPHCVQDKEGLLKVVRDFLAGVPGGRLRTQVPDRG